MRCKIMRNCYFIYKQDFEDYSFAERDQLLSQSLTLLVWELADAYPFVFITCFFDSLSSYDIFFMGQFTFHDFPRGFRCCDSITSGIFHDFYIGFHILRLNSL